MPIDFFETEVSKAQEKFNQTYGVMIVCNIKHRQATIMSIIHLSLLCRRITAARSKNDVRGDIQKFIRSRDTINNHLNLLTYVNQSINRSINQKPLICERLFHFNGGAFMQIESDTQFNALKMVMEEFQGTLKGIKVNCEACNNEYEVNVLKGVNFIDFGIICCLFCGRQIKLY